LCKKPSSDSLGHQIPVFDKYNTIWLFSMLETRNIKIYYGKIMVVRGLSLKVEAGQIRAILGANGAGKSTTLKTIMGYLDDQPEKGSIWFQGKRIDGMHTEHIVRLGIAYVPEGREVFPELTLRENLCALQCG
jgi:branched-chain amino acid transport system ATP-binding protein